MKRSLMFTLLWAAVSVAVSEAAAAPPLTDSQAIRPTFLLPGDYHADEAPLHPGEGWLALAPMGKRWQLFSTEVKSSRYVDEITDGPGERTGVRLKASRKDAVALLRFPNMTPGPLPVADIDIDEGGLPVEAAKPLSFTFKGSAYRIEVVRQQAYLVKGAQRTPLKDLKINADGEDGARLQWAGDLDGDGELDLMMAWFVSNGGGSCLYLSSQKTGAYLLKQVACHGGYGC